MRNSLLAMYMCAAVHGYAVTPKDFINMDEINRYSYWTAIEKISSSMSTLKNEISQLNANVNSLLSNFNTQTKYGWQYIISYYDTYEDTYDDAVDNDPLYTSYSKTYDDDSYYTDSTYSSTYDIHYETYDTYESDDVANYRITSDYTYEIYDTYEPDDVANHRITTYPAPDYDANNVFANWFDIEV